MQCVGVLKMVGKCDRGGEIWATVPWNSCGGWVGGFNMIFKLGDEGWKKHGQ